MSWVSVPASSPGGAILRRIGIVFCVLLLGLGAVVVWNVRALEAEIAGHAQAVEAVAAAAPLPAPTAGELAALPEPVRRYVAFAFPEGIPPVRLVRMTMTGDFRRPGTTGFAPMTAHQVVSPGEPAFVFWGTTDVLPGVWAVAMDSYVEGRMRMIAKVLSTLSVMDVRGDPALDDTSRLRFLLEGPLFPTGLLPGPHLRWEAIDGATARLVALRDGEDVGAYRVSFGEDGRILRYDAEPRPGAANGRYHGAGEVALRSDYRKVGGMMLPMRFTIARRIEGAEQAFWSGQVQEIVVEPTVR